MNLTLTNAMPLVALCFISTTNLFSQPPATVDTVTSLANQPKSIVYLKISVNKAYRMQRVAPSKIARTPESSDERSGGTRGAHPAAAATASNFFSSSTDCSGETFAGKDRAVVKTKLVTGTKKTFDNINAFFASGLLIPDADMRNHQPKVSKDANSTRVPEEKINVVINKGFLYGIYREDDNDFHIIIGNGKPGNHRKLFNIEVSGLPEGNASLNIAREKVIEKFGDLSCSDGAFKPIDVLIPIKVEGSLFYDIDHPPGKVGFGTYKPKTAWEIHPVKNISFLDE